MTYVPQSKNNSNPQHQQQTTKATAQTFSDNREFTSSSLPLQTMMANSPQQQKLKFTAQLMANSPVQQKINTSVQNLANKSELVQRMEEEEPLQDKFESEPIQPETAFEASRPNNTGLPDNLKAGIENLSGMNMDHVRVHYNSDKPAQLQAHAYAQGSEIHVAPGQEQHLPHEAWHVVQQVQGRVRPTTQMKAGVQVNDDVGLESEADLMGSRAVQMKCHAIPEKRTISHHNAIIQPKYARDSERKVEDLYKPRFSSFLGSYIKILSPEKNSLQRIQELATGDIWRYDFTDDSYTPIAKAAHVYLENIEISGDTSDLKQNITIEKGVEALVGDAIEQSAPGYLGEAIVYSGEKNAASLAKKYVEGTQDWSEEKRKSRIGVNFGINKFADFDQAEHGRTTQDVAGKTENSFNATKDKASTHAVGFTWGFSFKGGGLPGKRTTAEIRGMIETEMIGGQPVKWKKGDEDHDATKEEVITKFRNLRKSAGIPYGMLRSLVGERGDGVQSKLEANNATPVYIHSLDADAPDFETLKKGKEEGEWSKVLDAYDEIIEATGDHDMIIGGYNLLANPEAYAGKDYEHTIRSNVVDLAIRQAVHSVAPSMTYPTEPNFLIKAKLYKDVRKSIGAGKNVWGDGTSEGRALYDRVLKEKKGKADVHYDPLASVATGVDAGGARLKIDSNKTYNQDSILGKPQGSKAKEGDKISLEDQYIVQAQSLAGAGRLATAYIAAYTALGGRDVKVKKNHMSEIFSRVEPMVLALLSGDDIKYDVASPSFDDSLLPVDQILKAIQQRLVALKQHPDFDGLVK